MISSNDELHIILKLRNLEIAFKSLRQTDTAENSVEFVVDVAKNVAPDIELPSTNVCCFCTLAADEMYTPKAFFHSPNHCIHDKAIVNEICKPCLDGFKRVFKNANNNDPTNWTPCPFCKMYFHREPQTEERADTPSEYQMSEDSYPHWTSASTCDAVEWRRGNATIKECEEKRNERLNQ